MLDWLSSYIEADRLFKLGIQQYSKSQFREALPSWEQALTLYREIGDRSGEGNSLGSLGNAYYFRFSIRRVGIGFTPAAQKVAKKIKSNKKDVGKE